MHFLLSHVSQQVLASSPMSSVPPVTKNEKRYCIVATILYCTILQNKYLSLHKINYNASPPIIISLPQYFSLYNYFALHLFFLLHFLSLTFIIPLRLQHHFTPPLPPSLPAPTPIPFPQPSCQNHCPPIQPHSPAEFLSW